MNIGIVEVPLSYLPTTPSPRLLFPGDPDFVTDIVTHIQTVYPGAVETYWLKETRNGAQIVCELIVSGNSEFWVGQEVLEFVQSHNWRLLNVSSSSHSRKGHTTHNMYVFVKDN